MVDHHALKIEQILILLANCDEKITISNALKFVRIKNPTKSLTNWQGLCEFSRFGRVD